MPLERRMSRDAFLPDEIVELKHVCFTPGRIFQPGKYIAGELPDLAFSMGLVAQLPPVKGNSVEIGDPPLPQPDQQAGMHLFEIGDSPTPHTDEEDGIYL